MIDKKLQFVFHEPKNDRALVANLFQLLLSIVIDYNRTSKRTTPSLSNKITTEINFLVLMITLMTKLV